MKKIILSLLFVVFAGGVAQADIVNAQVKACHDAVWSLDEFKNIPNAGISAYPGGFDEKSFYAYWIVDWDDLQVAGKCLMDRKETKVNKIVDFRKK